MSEDQAQALLPVPKRPAPSAGQELPRHQNPIFNPGPALSWDKDINLKNT